MRPAMVSARAQTSMAPAWLVEQIGRIERLAADLGVEVEAAGPEAAGLQDVIERQRGVRDVVRELVGVPAQLRIAAVHVDRTEDAERGRQRDLMLEAVAGKRRVVVLDVDLDLLLEAVGLQEAEDRGGVEIVLMLGRLRAASARSGSCP